MRDHRLTAGDGLVDVRPPMMTEKKFQGCSARLRSLHWHGDVGRLQPEASQELGESGIVA